MTRQGWVCPKCDSAISPDTDVCPACSGELGSVIVPSNWPGPSTPPSTGDPLPEHQFIVTCGPPIRSGRIVSESPDKLYYQGAMQ